MRKDTVHLFRTLLTCIPCWLACLSISDQNRRLEEFDVQLDALVARIDELAVRIDALTEERKKVRASLQEYNARLQEFRHRRTAALLATGAASAEGPIGAQSLQAGAASGPKLFRFAMEPAVNHDGALPAHHSGGFVPCADSMAGDLDPRGVDGLVSTPSY